MLWGHTVRSPHAHARDPRDRHLRGGRDARACTRCSRTPTSRARKTTASSSPTSRCWRSTVSSTTASRSRSSRPSTRAGAPRRRVDPRRLRAARAGDRHGARDRAPDLHPEKPTQGHGYREDDRPNVVRHMVIRHGDPDAAATSPSRGSTTSASRIRRSSAPSRGLPSRTARAASTSTSRPSGCTSTATRSLRAWARRGAGAHPPRGRRRRLRRPRGSVDAGSRCAARAAHRTAR